MLNQSSATGKVLNKRVNEQSTALDRRLLSVSVLSCPSLRNATHTDADTSFTMITAAPAAKALMRML
jgi:hypothetical protein